MTKVSVDSYCPIPISISSSRFRHFICRIEESCFGFTYQKPVLLLPDMVPQNGDFVLVDCIVEFRLAQYSKDGLHFPDNFVTPGERWALSVIGVIVPFV